MGIRDIPLEDRPEIGRKLYEARLTPMLWGDACEAVLGRDYVSDTEAGCIATLARNYALTNGKAWPPDCGDWRDFPNSRERRAARKIAREKNAQGWRISSWRQALRVSLADLAARFIDVSPDEMARIEYEGPDDTADYETIMSMLGIIKREQDEAEASAPPIRDWLILTDGPARFASELPASA